MGCCLSTPATANKTSHRRPDDSKRRLKLCHVITSTPSPPFEKEAVKEVLPATRTPISTLVIDDAKQILHEDDAGKKLNQENVTETSEMYSYSESTTMLTDIKRDVVEIEDDQEVTQKVITSPPSEKVPRKRPTKFSGRISEEDGGIRFPPRRLVAPLPTKKCRFPSKKMQTTQRVWNVGPPDIVRRDLPARRSRPPAIRGQRLNIRNGSPASAKNSGEKRIVKSSVSEGNVKVVKVGVPSEPERRESLDNPVISLECFIFV